MDMEDLNAIYFASISFVNVGERGVYRYNNNFNETKITLF